MIYADVVVVAAGKGSRFGEKTPKQFQVLENKPILAHSLLLFEQHPGINSIIIVGAADWLFFIAQDIVDAFGISKVRQVVSGGKERTDSVSKGLAALDASSGRPVLIHDAARPLLKSEIIDRVLAGLQGVDACIPTVPCTDTVKEVVGNFIENTIPRANLRFAQTPQGFCLPVLLHALKQQVASEDAVTDEAMLVEKHGGHVRWVDGSLENIKITSRLDLDIAELILEKRKE